MSRANPRFRRNNAALPALTVPAYRITVFYLVDQQICLFNQDYLMTNPAQTGSSEANLAASFNTTCLGNLRAALSSDCFITQYKVQCLSTPSRQPSILAVATANQAGTVVGQHLPSEMAMILSKQTPTKGQHGRGRLFLPGVPTSFVTPGTDANRLNTTGTNAALTVATSLQANTITDAGNVALAAVTTRVLKGAPTLNGQVLTGIFVRLLLGVIRRRRIGRGK